MVQVSNISGTSTAAARVAYLNEGGGNHGERVQRRLNHSRPYRVRGESDRLPAEGLGDALLLFRTLDLLEQSQDDEVRVRELREFGDVPLYLRQDGQPLLEGCVKVCGGGWDGYVVL